MTRILLLTTFIVGLFSCSSKQTANSKSNNSDTIASKDSTIECPVTDLKVHLQVDRVHIGMTIDELKKEYSTAEFKKEPVWNYGVDGGGDGLLVITNGDPLFFVWTMEGEDKIAGITVVSPTIPIEPGIHVGMTFKDFQKLKPEAKLAIDMISHMEFSYVASLNYRIEFLTEDSNRVGKYNNDGAEPEFISVSRPNTKVDRISILE
jgi:hypothetical protein